MIGAVVAIVVVGAVALIVFGVRGSESQVEDPFASASPTTGSGGSAMPELVWQRLLSMVGGGWLALTATGWPVLAVFVAAFGWVSVDLRLAKRKRTQTMERVEAVASFAETLRDLTSSGSGLREAIRLSARVAPEAIFEEANDLAAGLQRQQPAMVLAKFADDLALPESDLVVHSLLVAVGREGGSVSEVLSGAAEGARERAAMLREVEAGRARTSSEAKTVSVVSALIVAVSVASGGSLVEPYGGIFGQIVLAVVLTMFGGAGYMMYQLGKFSPTPRVVSSMASAVGVTVTVGDDETTPHVSAGVAS